MNNEIFFENKTNFKEKIVLYGYKICSRRANFLKILKILKIVYLVISSVSALYLLFKKDYLRMIFHLFFIFLILFNYKIVYFIARRQQKYNFYLEKTYKFYENKLEVITDISKLTLIYNKINIAFENSDAFYMVFENRLMCIDKTGFTVGNATHFDSFIKSKIRFK